MNWEHWDELGAVGKGLGWTGSAGEEDTETNWEHWEGTGTNWNH